MGIHVDPEEVFHVLLDGEVIEMSLDALADAYEGEVVVDATLIWQEGLGEWLRLDVVLASLESASAPQSFAPPVAEPEDMYAVLLGPNEVKQMSLDQLNDAYRLSIVDNETNVWQPGFAEWQPLGALLGESEAPAPSGWMASTHAPVGASPARVVPSSFAPVAYSFGPSPGEATYKGPILVPEASPWFKRVVLAAALIAGAVILLQNGAFHQALGRRTLASIAPRWVPEPSLDTPHGTARFLEELETKYHLDRLLETEPFEAPAENTRGSAKEPSTKLAASGAPAADAAAAPSALPTKASPPSGAEAPPPPPPPSAVPSSAPLPASGPVDLRGQVLPAAPLKTAPAPKKPAPRARSKSKSYQGSNDPYDPMNGQL
jgi:hypothetical protein